MRAVAVRSFKAPPELIELPRPDVGPAEVGVRVQAAGINPFDAKVADGILDGQRPHRFPLVLGSDAAGVVDSVGPAVRRFRVGDRVFGSFLHDPVGVGTYAEFSTVPESNAVALFPTEVSAAEAAALPTAGMTALDALDRLNLPAGARLLIVGASGGVGSFATRLAATRGIRVIAAGRADSADRAREMGATETVEVGAGLIPGVRSLAPEGVDGLLDLLSPGPAFQAIATLVKPGRLSVTSVYAADPHAAGGAQVNLNLQPTAALLERLLTEVRRAQFPIPVERRVSLDDAPAALAAIRAGHGRGKTVIEP